MSKKEFLIYFLILSAGMLVAIWYKDGYGVLFFLFMLALLIKEFTDKTPPESGATT